jgi:hypothetical protein
LTDVELLRELIQDGSVAILVFFYDRNDQSDQLVPKVNTVQPGAVVFWISLGLSRFRLNRKRRVVIASCGRTELFPKVCYTAAAECIFIGKLWENLKYGD